MRIDIHLQEKPLCVDFQLRLFEVDRSWAGSLFAHKCCDANLVSGRLFSKWNLSFNQTVLKEQSTELTLQVYNTVLIRCRLARWAIPAVQLLSASFKEAWRTVFRLNSANAIQLPLKLCAPSFFIPPHLETHWKFPLTDRHSIQPTLKQHKVQLTFWYSGTLTCIC